jgi:CRP/FNR family transcriptional regulator, anaerobic regulatory protein
MYPTVNENFNFSAQISEKLYEYGQVKLFKTGEMIVNEDAYIRAIPIVLKGSIRVMRTDEEGKEILLYYITRGESCIMSFLGGIHQDTSKIKAVAEEDVEILFIPIDKTKLLIKESEEWLDYIFRLYHKRFEELLYAINSIAFKKVDERILHFLQEKKKLSGSSDIQITHQELADELGSARAVVSRLLKQMETEGLVQLGRNKIHLM